MIFDLCIAYLAGFRIWVQDDRPDWVTPQRFPDAERLYPQPFAQLIPDLQRIPQLYIALLTRSYNLDGQTLRAIYHSGPHYLGMIGSRKQVQAVLQTLAQEGIPEANTHPKRRNSVDTPTAWPGSSHAVRYPVSRGVGLPADC
ncbi:XdhC family protein [Synechococcus sp. H55.8]